MITVIPNKNKNVTGDALNKTSFGIKSENVYNLTTGPGRLTQAFKITLKHNNLDATDSGTNNYFYFEENRNIARFHKFKVAQTSRIGISTGIDKKWRFIMLSQDPHSLQYQPSKFLSK